MHIQFAAEWPRERHTSMNSMIATIALNSALAASALAQHAGDIVLSVENGRIRTAIELGEGLIEPSRVFASEMGEIAPGFTDEPGFDCEIGAFPYPSTVGFQIHGPLLRWIDGTGDGRSPETMSVAFGPLGPVASPSCNTLVDGFSLAVGSNGTWHRHLEFTIDESAPGGVYILGLELFSSDPSAAASRPFWIVFNHGAEESEHDAAIEWTESTLAGAACAADFDADGVVAVPDIFTFLSAWFAGPDTPGAWRVDFDGSCGLAVPDIFSFLSAWFAACE